MKTLLILSSLLFFLSNNVFAREIILSNGESITLGNTTVSCGGPSGPGPGPVGEEPSEYFYLNGQSFRTGLSGQTAFVESLSNGARYKLGCCLLKEPKAIVFDNQVFHFGVGTNNALYYQVGLNSGAWRPTNGTLLNQDDYTALVLDDSFILFGMGTNSAFYMAEFDRNGTLLENRWSPLNGSGTQILSVYRIGGNDFMIRVIGTNGREYSRTRHTAFVLAE